MIRILPWWFAIAAALLLRPAFGSPCAPPANGSVIHTAGLPFGIATTPDGCWLFLSNAGPKKRGALDVLHDVGGTYAQTRVVPLQSPGLGETLSRDDRLLIVATGIGIEVFSVPELEQPAADALLASLRQDGPRGRPAGTVYVLTSADDHLLFASEEGASRVAVYDLQAWRATGFKGRPHTGYIPARLGPVGLALAPDGRWLYATIELASPLTGDAPNCRPEVAAGRWHPNGSVLRIDVARAAADPARSVTGAVQAGCNPVRVAVSPNGRYLWVTERGSGRLLQLPADVFAPDAGTVKAHTIDVHGEPVGVAVRPDGQQVWITLSDRFARAGQGADLGRQLIGVLGAGNRPAGPAKLVSEPASGFPRELAFLPDGRTLAVAMFRTKRVEFITTPP